jgi:hypothetical protein
VHNGVLVGETAQGIILDGTYNVFSASMSTMLLINPGDTLQVALLSFLTGAFTFQVSSATVFANRV